MKRKQTELQREAAVARQRELIRPKYVKVVEPLERSLSVLRRKA